MSDDEIAALRERFKQRTADEAKVLRNSLERGEFGAAEVKRLAHTLVGTGGLLGFPAAQALALSLLVFGARLLVSLLGGVVLLLESVLGSRRGGQVAVEPSSTEQS